jgi:4-hydroxy-4-methyl-2-oxoglutarate aldolase
MDSALDHKLFEQLSQLDTCTVSNAIERLNVRLRNEGFISGAVRCRFPRFAPMLGYAVTGRIRTSTPPMRGKCYYDRIDFWEYLASLPGPRVMVLQDVDEQPGLGAFVGEMHASIGMALNCVGYISNGAVRDLPAVRKLGFQMFSGSVAVSHAYAHLVDFGQPVEVGGLKISPGDLMHGDLHGVHSIPLDIAAQIPGEVEQVLESEREIKRYCRSSDFSLQGLSKRLQRVAIDCL